MEAEAGSKEGVLCYIADRPGNKPLPAEHKFNVVQSFQQLFNDSKIKFNS